jgi:hypothetical protein
MTIATSSTANSHDGAPIDIVLEDLTCLALSRLPDISPAPLCLTPEPWSAVDEDDEAGELAGEDEEEDDEDEENDEDDEDDEDEDDEDEDDEDDEDEENDEDDEDE